MPLTRQYNLNIQYEFARNWVIEFSYVGSSGINLLDIYHNENMARLASPSNPINGQIANTLANVNLRIPYLGFQPEGLQGTEFNGRSNYNSLQVTVRKKFSYGLSLQGAYTWSKSLSDLPGDVPTGGVYYGMNSNNANDPGPAVRPDKLESPAALHIKLQLRSSFRDAPGSGGQASRRMERCRNYHNAKRHSANVS